MALTAAASWGASDYVAGRTSRVATGMSVVAAAHLTGLIALLIAVPLLPASVLSSGAVTWGATAGVCGSLGAALLYRGLAIGRMAVVAPVTAAVSAALPTIAGVLLGDSLSTPLLLGIALALAAVVLVATSPDTSLDRPAAALSAAAAAWTSALAVPSPSGTVTVVPPRRTILGTPGASWLLQPGLREALLGGVGFGTFFLFLERAPNDSGLYPLVAARVASVGLLFAVAYVTDKRALPRAAARPAAALVGVLDIAAAVLYLLATHTGPLAVVAVLASLCPVATVGLARALDKERCGRVQIVGLAAAAVGVALLSAG